MLHAADALISVARFRQPRAEPEIALVLDRALRGPGLSVSDLMSATAYALPAIEIIDSRIRDWRIGLIDTIADNASSGGPGLGPTPTPPRGAAPAPGGCLFRRRRPAPVTGAAP